MTEVDAVPTPLITAVNNEPPGDPTDGVVDKMTGFNVIPFVVSKSAPLGVPLGK